jgi:hypothetical protein
VKFRRGPRHSRKEHGLCPRTFTIPLPVKVFRSLPVPLDDAKCEHSNGEGSTLCRVVEPPRRSPHKEVAHCSRRSRNETPVGGNSGSSLSFRYLNSAEKSRGMPGTLSSWALLVPTRTWPACRCGKQPHECSGTLISISVNPRQIRVTAVLAITVPMDSVYQNGQRPREGPTDLPATAHDWALTEYVPSLMLETECAEVPPRRTATG